MVRVLEEHTPYWSQSRKATGGLERIPYDPILYGDYLASELGKDATLYKRKQEICEQGPQFPLGGSGHFGEVVKSIPLRMMVETQVYGPAHTKAVRYAHDMFYDENSDIDINNGNDKPEGDGGINKSRQEYVSRDIDPHLVRDNIIFMPTLEAKVNTPGPTVSQVRQPDKIVGKALDESQIFDDGHLPVKAQLCDRLVRVDRKGFVVKAGPVKPPIEFLEKFKAHSTELDPKLNTQLRSALENFANLYCADKHLPKNIEHKGAFSSNEGWNGRTRRNKIKIMALSQKMKKKIHAIISHTENEGEEILDDDHPNIQLRQSIDRLDTDATQLALKEGADVNFQSNGRTPIQTVFARLCKVDSGDELNRNMHKFEEAADVLAGWNCEMNNLDCDVEWSGWAPIHYAAYYGHLMRLEWLIRYGASIHTKTSEGFTPLMLASEMGYFRHVYLLVKSGADFREVDPFGRTVLHYAAGGGNLNVVKFLVECGSVFDKKKPCKQGDTPLSISARVDASCFDYLRKVAIPKQRHSPYIDKFLSSQGIPGIQFSKDVKKKGNKFLKRGMVIRRKR